MDSNIEFIKLKYENFNNLEDIKLKLCSHPIFIKKWALLGSFLGYEYCRGSNTRIIGEGYNVTKSNDSYYIQAINTSEFYNNRGWRPRIRLNMKVSNLKFKFIPDTILPLISKKQILKPKILSENYVVNNFDYINNTVKKINNSGSVSINNNIQHSIFKNIPLTNSYRFIYNDKFNDRGFKYDFSDKYTLENQINEIKKYKINNTIKLNMPPKSKILVKSILERNKVILPYTALVLISYNITLTGRINYDKNAYLGYLPGFNIATNFTFGNDNISAIDDVNKQYLEKFNTQDFYWDWNNLSKDTKFKSFMDKFNKSECVEIKGEFSKLNYNSIKIESGNAESLTI